MNVSRRYAVSSRITLALAIVFLSASVAGCLGFDGVAVLNLNADLGKARRGDELTQVVHVVNYTLRPITVLFVPTCGCTASDKESHSLSAFSTLDIPITYTAGPKMSGQIKREVAIVYKIGDKVRRTSGQAHFMVTP